MFNPSVSCKEFYNGYTIVVDSEDEYDIVKIILKIYGPDAFEPIQTIVQDLPAPTFEELYGEVGNLLDDVKGNIDILGPPEGGGLPTLEVPNIVTEAPSEPGNPPTGGGEFFHAPITREYATFGDWRQLRKGWGRNEDVEDVYLSMLEIIQTVDTSRIRYLDNDNIRVWETRMNCFERLLGLYTSEVPQNQMLASEDVGV